MYIPNEIDPSGEREGEKEKIMRKLLWRFVRFMRKEKHILFHVFT